MQRFGGFLCVMGAGSMVLHFLNANFILMSWVDAWGPTVGWVIRGAILAIGLGMIIAANAASKGPSQP